MTVFLLRHAKAGDREAWSDDDRLRPLSGRGHLQARVLVELLRDATFDRILSSPYVRCMETVVPIAGVRGMPVEPVEELSEAAPLDAAIALVRKHAISGALMCMHGDVLQMLLDYYAAAGIEIPAEREWPKGCVWTLETDNTGEIVRARYTPPPPA
ncbi:MAG: 8-oxo-(d)GTP phosphatase [Actinomycetota bacterium]|nr:8-oxo-(d)GTP phosphatase [Actinomycetota bacterium]